jgi:hypothetical protein
MNLINRSSDYQLDNLLNQLGVANHIICSKDELKKYLKKPTIRNIIFNISSTDHGSHWVAIDKKSKMYFDSYAQPPPTVVPKDYKLASIEKELQSIEAQDCGQLCCLFLYYSNFKSIKDFYNLFKDIYK